MGCTTHNCNNRLDFTPRSPAQCRRFGLVKCNNFYHTHKSDFLQRFVAQLQRLSPALAKVDHRESRKRNKVKERERANRSRKNCSTLRMPQIFPKEMQQILLCAARFPRKQRKRARRGLVDKFFPYTKSRRSRSR